MFDPKAANAANANASPPAAPGVALNASLTVPAPSNGNTWLGELAGLFLPKQKVPPTQPVAKQVMIGNLVIGVRPGIEINVVEPSPGVTVIVEYPANSPVVGIDAGSILGIAQVANSLTGGIVDMMAKYNPGAQRVLREAEAARVEEVGRATADAQAYINMKLADAQDYALRLAEERERDRLEWEERQARRKAKLAEDVGASRESLALARPPLALAAFQVARLTPDIAGDACCRSCAVGAPCESDCKGDRC